MCRQVKRAGNTKYVNDVDVLVLCHAETMREINTFLRCYCDRFGWNNVMVTIILL